MTQTPIFNASFALLLTATAALAAPPEFNKDIRPILSDNCFACHGPDQHKAKGGVQLHLAETATAELKDGGRPIVPGNRNESLAWKRITHTDPDERMPPADSAHVLTAAQIDTLGRWIDAGAVYQGHWAFQPIHSSGKSIDELITTDLAGHGMQLSPAADPATLVRRLYLDLTGLPPSPEAVTVFAADPSEAAWQAMVDKLLASPACAERLAVDWLDAARYADTNGFSIDDHREMWLWRDWVIRAFLDNMPLDRFISEQLAGDLMPDATVNNRLATGFLRNSMNTHEGGTIAEEYRVAGVADKVDTVATTFMGLTMKCAQCHDHKYDPIKQKEYYQFFAFFNESSEPGKGAQNANTAPMITASSPLRSEEEVRQDAARRIAQLERLRIVLTDELVVARRAWELENRPASATPTTVAAAPAPELPIQASWIWPEKGNRPAEEFRFRHKFAVPAGAHAARLLMTCDDAAEVTLAGKQVAAVTLWMEPAIVSLGDLKADEATLLTVTARNASPSPAGLILQLQWQNADGSWHQIGTDADWQWSPTDKENWQPVQIIAPYGAGPWKAAFAQAAAAPPDWKNLLLIPEAKRTDAQWTVINAQFAAKNKATGDLFKQIDLEQNILKDQAEKGQATTMVMDHNPKARKTYILSRGSYASPGDEVNTGFPASLPAATTTDAPLTRLDLAAWLVRADHPLTARAMANRYWQLLFGAGIVRTPEDFGSQGEWPTHPQVLDTLAADLIASNWNLRAMLRQIVSSRTYRQQAAASSELIAADPQNRLLARAPRFRLPAETVRDNALAIAGLLDTTVGGMSVYPLQPDGLWREVSHFGYPSPFTSQRYLPGGQQATIRRSMYTAWKRTAPPPSMMIFDAPSRETCTARRLATNTPLQALVLQNDPQFLMAARALGARLQQAGDNDSARLTAAFRLALARPPHPNEAAVLTRAVARWRQHFSAAPDAAKALQLDPTAAPEAAAWTMIASTILNMDETITRQ